MWKSIAKLEFKRFEGWANWKIHLGAITSFSGLCCDYSLHWLLEQQVKANISLSKLQYHTKFSVF